MTRPSARRIVFAAAAVTLVVGAPPATPNPQLRPPVAAR